MGALANCVVFGTRGRLGSLVRRAWEIHGDVPEFAPRCDLRMPATTQVPSLQGATVICLAGVTPATAAAGLDINDNAKIAHGMMELAASQGAKGVLFMSSIAVYGSQGAPWSEEAPLTGASAYAQAKIEMERVMAEQSANLELPATCLRLGNVAGADAALGGWTEGAQMDQFSDGSTPMRSYIGPQSLARILADLALKVATLPPVLNVGLGPAIQMGDLLDAAGLAWSPRPAPPEAIEKAELDLTLLTEILGPLPRTSPKQLVQEVAQL